MSDQFSQEYQNLEEMPEYMKGFQDQVKFPVLAKEESTGTPRKPENEGITEAESAEMEAADAELEAYLSEHEVLRQKITEWVDSINDKANPYFEFLMLEYVAKLSTRALERAMSLHPQMVLRSIRNTSSWPIELSRTQTNWNSDGMPDSVKAIWNELQHAEQRSLGDRLGVWVKASLRALIEIRSCPYNFCEIYERPSYDQIEAACRLPELRPPFKKLGPWVNAIYDKIFQECDSVFTYDILDPSDKCFCNYYLDDEFEHDRDFQDEDGEVFAPFLVSEQEAESVGLVAYKGKYDQNKYACALFTTSLQAAADTYRSKELAKNAKAKQAEIEEVEEKLGWTTEGKKKETQRRESDAKKEIEKIEERYAEEERKIRSLRLAEGRFNEAIKNAIRSRLSLLLKP